MQGEEREAAKLFKEVLRQSVRAGLFAVMAEKVEAEAGFRKVRGHEDLPKLAQALSTIWAARPKPPQADIGRSPERVRHPISTKAARQR